MTARTSFGQWLKQRRNLLDLTREDLAQQVGCAVITLKKIEADQRRPSKQMAELFAEHLNILASERTSFIRFARAEPGEDGASWGKAFHPPTNLPAQPTMLIGREDTVAALYKRLLQPATRLLTLTGPPGIGKTRLGLEVAVQALDDFPDGTFFVALAPITDANQVIPTISSTLGVLDVGPQPPLERLKVFLREKQILLLLDNFEQILSAASQIADLLAACPWLRLLVTSRAPLRIRHERQIPVMPLALPYLVTLPDVETVMGYSAVTLFLERAQAVKPDFVLTQDNAPAIAALCARLDGLPLAIELISARIKLLSPAALLERLSGQLLLQSEGLRDLEPRHRTLNAAIEWSYQLLSADEQTLLRRLGVFVGGWTLEAAESVCMEGLTITPLDGLASLLDKSLIKQEAGIGGDMRFTMLETIREYALERLISNSELETLQRQHTEYFLMLAETSDVGYAGSQRKKRWDRLEADLANYRAALVWSRTEASSEAELRLAVALRDFLGRRGYLSEGIRLLAEAVAHSKDVSRPESRRLQARALDDLGIFELWQDDLDAAQRHIEDAIAIYRELGDTAGLAEALGDYGLGFIMRGNVERAAVAIEESLTLYREVGNLGGIAECCFFQGNLAYLQNQWQQATMLWEESLARYRALDIRWMIANVLASLGMVALDQGEYEHAQAQLTESLELHRQLGEKWQTIQTLELFARLAVEQRQQSGSATSTLLRAARLFGAAEALRETYGVSIFPFHRQGYQRRVAALRARLDEAMLAATWAEGRAMTLEQAVTYALDHKITFTEVPALETDNNLELTKPRHDANLPLSESFKARELEVLRLVTQGLSNREIAAKLFLSPVTVKWYLSEIYGKFHVNSRTQAVARARELNLLS